MKFRKKPAVIEAIQWTGINDLELLEFVGLGGESLLKYPSLMTVNHPRQWDGRWLVATLEGPLLANMGDWIIRGIKGEFYPCKPDIFEATYEAVE